MTANKQTQELLDAVIAAHGGLDRWNQIKTISVTFNFTGRVLELKCGIKGIITPTCTIATKSPPNATFTNLVQDNKSAQCLFTTDKVSIVSPDGETLSSRSDPRASFADHKQTTPWDDHHLQYFISYAMYNYLTTPFIFTLPGFCIEEVAPHQEYTHTAPWRVLQVTYPDGFPTHSKVQRFYFGAKDFLLKRLDYKADVVPGFGAHYVFDNKRVGGLVIPTTRRVVRRADEESRVAQLDGQSSFHLQYVSVKVVDEDGTEHTEAQRVEMQN